MAEAQVGACPGHQCPSRQQARQLRLQLDNAITAHRNCGALAFELQRQLTEISDQHERCGDMSKEITRLHYELKELRNAHESCSGLQDRVLSLQAQLAHEVQAHATCYKMHEEIIQLKKRLQEAKDDHKYCSGMATELQRLNSDLLRLKGLAIPEQVVSPFKQLYEELKFQTARERELSQKVSDSETTSLKQALSQRDAELLEKSQSLIGLQASEKQLRLQLAALQELKDSEHNQLIPRLQSELSRAREEVTQEKQKEMDLLRKALQDRTSELETCKQAHLDSQKALLQAQKVSAQLETRHRDELIRIEQLLAAASIRQDVELTPVTQRAPSPNLASPQPLTISVSSTSNKSSMVTVLSQKDSHFHRQSSIARYFRFICVLLIVSLCSEHNNSEKGIG
jgi:hypothetical protein